MTFSNGHFHSDVQALDDQLEIFYNSVRTEDVVYMTLMNWWMTETNDGGESAKSEQPAWYDNDDIYIYIYINVFL